MSKVFEVGKEYYCADTGFDPIKILKRTQKMVFVENGSSKWRMRIRQDKDGNEYVVDSSTPVSWRDIFIYSAAKEVNEFEEARMKRVRGEVV